MLGGLPRLCAPLPSRAWAPPSPPGRGLTGFLQHQQPPLGFLEGQHVGRLGRVEAEAALVVALPGEVIVDAGRS